MQLDTAASVATITSALIPIFGGMYALTRMYKHREHEMSERISVLQVHLERIEKQFGPNGGGLREAVNNIDKRLRAVDEKVQMLHVEHAKLAGKFSMIEE